MAWLDSRSLWDAFLNPTFLPSLLYRTIAASVIAALVAMVVVNVVPGVSRADREELVRRAAWLTAPMVFMPVLGVWLVGAMPPDSREWIMGGSMAMTLMLNIAVAASALVGGYAVIGLLRHRLYVNGATATVLCVMALAATACGEFVREGVRKPYTMREVLYSNAVRPEQVAALRERGLTATDPYPLRGADRLPVVAGGPHPQLHTGALVFRQQCAVCHTLCGVNSLPGLTTEWDTEMKRQNFAKLQKLKPFMPPFAGTPAELEALVQFVSWVEEGRPAAWPDTSADPDYPARLAQILGWLDAAGTRPALVRGAHGGR